MKRFINIILILLFVLLWSCEEAFIPETPSAGGELVVEGYIEAGNPESPPAYVFITRSLPFYGEVNPDIIGDLFVRDASVTISDGRDTVELTEVCLEDLPPELQEEIRRQIGGGLSLDSIGYCAYVDLEDRLEREIGGEYELRIQTDETVLRARTSIPPHVAPDSITLSRQGNLPGDSLYQMVCHLTDPGGRMDYYRYFTRINNGPFEAPFTSVTDDVAFDGNEFSFPLQKAEPLPDEDTDTETFGLVSSGDTVDIKWTNIDAAHYDFWNTLEFNRSNQGPFSTYTLVESNIEGGLGIFGGYSVSIHRIIVPEF